MLAALTAGLAVVVALAAWRLSTGPISLDFLTPYIEQALQAEDAGYSVKLDRTVLTWAGWQRTLDIRAQGVRTFDANGDLMARVPELSVSLSARALVQGKVAPTSLEIIGARMELERREDGSFALELGEDPGEKKEGAGRVDLLRFFAEELMKPPDRAGAFGYLSRVSIVGADMEIDDRLWDVEWTARLGQLTLERDVLGVRTRVALEIDVKGEVARFQAVGFYDRGQRAIDLGVSFSNFRPALFAESTPVLARLSAVRLPLSGAVNLKVDEQGRVQKADFALIGGAGRLALPLGERVVWDVRRLDARGRIENGLNRIVLENLEVRTAGPTLLASATVDRGADGVRAVADLAVREMAIDELPRYWPKSIGPNPRRWVTANLRGGTIVEARAKVALSAPEEAFDAVRVEKIGGAILFEGVTVEYLRPMPPVRKVAGRATFDAERFDIRLDRGTVLRDIALDRSDIAITGLQEDVQDIEIELVLRGPFRRVLEVVDGEPLGWPSELGINPADVDGLSAVRVVFRFPLLNDLAFDGVQVAAAANIAQARIDNVLMGKDFTDGTLSLKVNKARLDLEGEGRIAGIPVEVRWGENFRGGKMRTRLSLKGAVDETAREEFGISAGPLVAGPVGVDMLLTSSDRTTLDVVMALDFEETRLTLPDVGWSKPAGVPGAGRVRFRVVDGRIVRIDEFALSAAGLAARGEVLLGGENNRLRRVKLTKFVYDRNDITGVLTRRDDGGYYLEIDAASFDLQPFLDARERARKADEAAAERRAEAGGDEEDVSEEEEEGGLPPLSIIARAENVWVGDQPQQRLVKAEGTFEYDGKVWRSVDLAAGLFNGKRVTFRIDPDEKGRRVSISSDDAGAVLITFGLFYNMIGGELRLRGLIDDEQEDSPVTGTIQVANYRLVEAPTLAEVLRLASLTGIRDSLKGVGISFTRFQAPFTKVGGVIELRKGRAAGSEIGITFEGFIDVDREKVDLAGTIVPVYSLNSLPGNIPILGQLLVGEEGSGVFAASYRVRGPFDNPEVNVNPLAALAPGFLRGLVRFLDGSDVNMDAETAERPTTQEADR